MTCACRLSWLALLTLGGCMAEKSQDTSLPADSEAVFDSQAPACPAETCATPEDDDCDGLTNEADATGCVVWYADQDGDGVGSKDSACLCEQAAPYTSDRSDDCDDQRATVVPDDGGCGLLGTDGSLSDAAAWLYGEEDGELLSGGGNAVVQNLGGLGAPGLALGARRQSIVAAQAGAVYLWRGPLAGAYGTTTAVARLYGEVEYAYTGYAVAGLDDLDDDGLPDLLISAHGELDPISGRVGAVYFVDGTTTGSQPISSAGLRLSSASERPGISLARVLSVDEDAAPGALIGAPQSDLSAASAGAVYLMGGPIGGPSDLDEDALAILYGGAMSDGLGELVDGDGDVNGDGISDLLVLADGVHTEVGTGVLFGVLGPAVGPLSADDADFRALYVTPTVLSSASLVSCGDMNGDGFSDLLTGVPYAEAGAGAAFLFLGGWAGAKTTAEADARIGGDLDHMYVGGSLAHLGDHDADGKSDVALSSEVQWDEPSFVLLFHGPLAGSMLWSDADRRVAFEDERISSEYSGSPNLLGPGDLDGDTVPDLIVAGGGLSWGGGVENGVAWLIAGGPGS